MSSAPSSSAPVRVYISYAPEDREYRDELVKHLYPYGDRLEILSDALLMPKDNRDEMVRELVMSADMFVMTISRFIPATIERLLISTNIKFKNIRVATLIVEDLKDGRKNLPYWEKEIALNDTPIHKAKNRQSILNHAAKTISDIASLINNTPAIERLNKEWEKQTGTLELDGLGLTCIPPELQIMPWLKTLSLNHNGISRIDYLNDLKNLTRLSLSWNSIEKIEHLDGLTKVKTLWLSHNKITRIEGLEKLTRLEALSLTDNQIGTIEGLDANAKLTILRLGENRISRIEQLAHLKHLQSLTLFSNPLEDIEELEQMPGLQTINLVNTPIRSIKPLLPFILSGMDIHLVSDPSTSDPGIFLINNNQLTEPSLEVIFQGREAILKYFRDANQRGIRQLDILKLILVGNSRAGKTNFSEYLRTGRISRNSNSTHLLDIKPWEPAFLQSEDQGPIRINIFDFGGQDYYHDAHRMYYSHDTAYILLWDTESNKYNEASETIPDSEEPLTYENFPLEYWLESIRYKVRDASAVVYKDEEGQQVAQPRQPANILVLQNKIDLAEGRLDQQQLQQRYPAIWGYFAISLKDKKRTKILPEVLGDFLQSLNLGGRKLISFEYKIILQFMEQEKGLRVLSLDAFHQECIAIIADTGIDFNRDNAEIIAQILNNTGLALYYKPDPKGSEEQPLIYTNIHELNQRIKTIMEIARRGHEKGLFRTSQLTGIDEAEAVLKLLCRNKSVIPIGPDAFLAPQFLPLKPDCSIAFFLPAFAFTQMRFVYKAYFHKSLLLHLFADYLKDMQPGSDTSRFPFWRNGILISRGEGAHTELVFVEFVKDEHAGFINIRTMKPFRLSGLEQEVAATIIRHSEGWTVEQQISVNGRDFFPVEKLQQQINANQLEVQCDHAVFSINEFRNIVAFTNLPRKLFISYSSKNSAFVKRFITHLEPLRQKGLIAPWYDRMIESGTRWDDAIRTEMGNSDIVIFLLSPDFLATEYIMQTEIPLAIKQLEGRKSKFFFVELLACGWGRTILSDYQQTDDSGMDKKNVISIGTADNDAQWNKIIDELEEKLKHNPPSGA